MSKWVVPKYYQTHINYCHVPPPHYYSIPKKGAFDWAKSLGLGMVDQHFTGFVDHIIANSEFTHQRIKSHYRSDAPVLHPPVRVEDFSYAEPRTPPYFVMICRLVPMKRPKMVARAFANLDTDVELVIIGSGPLQSELEQYNGVNVLSEISDEEVEEIVANSMGGIAFAELEHCGITPKEFQAAGKPVIAPNEPNLRNHIIDGETGVVVPVSDTGVCEGVNQVLNDEWDPNRIRDTATTWSLDAFAEGAQQLVRAAIGDEEEQQEQSPY